MRAWLGRWWWHALMGLVLLINAAAIQSWGDLPILIVAGALLIDAVMARRDVWAMRARHQEAVGHLQAVIWRLQSLRRTDIDGGRQ